MEIGIRVSYGIENLYKATSQVARDEIWEIKYGEDWKRNVLAIADAIEHLYKNREMNSELEIDFSFSSAQLLKRMILIFLMKNTDQALKSEMLDFILVIEDRIEDEMVKISTVYSPRINCWNKQRRVSE